MKKEKVLLRKKTSPNYDPLDRSSIRGLIEALELLEDFGFSGRSSPIDVYLDALTDVSLSVLTELRKDPSERAYTRFNRGLAFDEDILDELANPLQKVIITQEEKNFRTKIRNLHEDALAQAFFIDLVAFIGRIRRGDSVTKAFAASFTEFSNSTSLQQRPSDNDKKKTASLRRKTIDAYYWRQRKRVRN